MRNKKSETTGKKVLHTELFSVNGMDFVNRVGAVLVSLTFVFGVFFFVSSSYPEQTVAMVNDKTENIPALSIEGIDDRIYEFIGGTYDFFILKISSFVDSILPNKKKNNTITIIDGRFEPNKLVIELGETVVFKTEDGNSFWPASNLHPEHSTYSEFDPLKPIEPEESWSFTFNKLGIWGFHDHLRPFLRGEIIVLNEVQAVFDFDCLKKIQLGESVDKTECWENTLVKTLEDEGAKKAFEVFAHLYETEEEFAGYGCHWFAHKIGDAAYGDYLRHEDFSKVQFPPESSYCGYGYYHGFLEHYLRDNPDFDKAVGICEELIESRTDVLPRIRLNCYHAIGHGFIMEPADTGIWGNPHAFMESGITTCRKLEKYDERIECLQGAFNVISDWIFTNQYGLSPNPDDPMEFCREQENEEETLACYYELSMKLTPYITDGVLGFYNLYMKDIEDDMVVAEIINPLMAAMVQDVILSNEHLSLLYECRSLPERAQIPCLKGITGGFVAHGEPKKEYVKAIEFCSSSILTSPEKNICYWNIVRTFKGIYTEDVMDKVCLLLEPDYQYYCEEDYEI